MLKKYAYEIVNKNTPVKKKQNQFFSIWRGFICLTAKSHYEKAKCFTIRLYRRSILNFLVNFNLILATLKRSKV